MRFLQTSFLVGFVCLMVATSVEAKTTMAVGTHGARFTSDEAWQRRKVVASLGRDQFVLGGGSGVAMVFIEESLLLENEDEYREALKSAIALISVQTRLRGKLQYDRKEHFGHARAYMDADIKDIELIYTIQVLSRDGLTYRLIAWGMRSKAAEMEKQIDEVIAGFSFPPPGSVWDKQTVPHEVKHHLPGNTITFQMRDSVFHPAKLQGALLAYATDDDMHGIYGYEEEGSPRRIEYLLDQAMVDLNTDEPDEYKEHVRKDIRIGPNEGRFLEASNKTFSVSIAIVPLPANRLLELRYVHAGSPDLDRFDRDLFWKSVNMIPVESGLELPENYKKDETPALNKYQQEVASLSTPLLETDSFGVRSVATYDDQRYLACNYSEAVLIGPNGKQVLYSAEDWMVLPSFAKWQDTWLLSDGSGLLMDLDSQEPCNLDLKPIFMTTFGDKLYYVPLVEPTELPGYQFDSLSGASSELRVRHADGTDEQIIQLEGQHITGVSFVPSGTDALLRTRPKFDPANADYGFTLKLIRLTLATGKTRELGEWKTVEGLKTTPQGWLVTGTPTDKPRGIYLMNGTGKLTTLLTGDQCDGIGIEGDDLLYCQNEYSSANSKLTFRRIPLADLEQRGALCQPFCDALINQIAEQWAAEPAAAEPVDSPQAIAASVDRASAICEQLVGCPLPTDPLQVDELGEAMSYIPELSPSAVRLCNMLTTRALLDQGAEWIACDQYDVSLWSAIDNGLQSNLYAYGYTPSAIYCSTNFDTESGLWRPASTLLEEAKGRRLLLCLDANKLRQAVEASMPASAQKLDLDNAASLESLLSEAPRNHMLRKEIYDQLIAAGRYGQALQLANRFTAGPHVAAIDYQASFALQTLQGPDDKRAAELAVELQQVLQQYPTEQGLYLMLGVLYERVDEPPFHRSRACYNRVLEMSSWGAYAEQATARLEVINGDDQP